MSLSGQQRKILQDALIDAFPNIATLEQMLAYELNQNLRAIAGEGSLQEIVFKLIQVANSQGWVEDLVYAACSSNPGNLKLKAIAKEILLLPGNGDTKKWLSWLGKTIQLREKIEEIEQLKPDFEPSNLWSFHHCLQLLEKLLNDRQREEWIGDLEEVLYKMHDLKYPQWRFHIETLNRAFDLLIGVFITRINSFYSKKKSIK